ncbi:MAG: molybdopterin molybdenumtransferase MoeA [Sphingobacteriia bacterium]|nr:MAG: molybdopterin molybdenumtransferase MoeA [Sphingobacteriia bacterium]TAG30283.1 MAG: molybdopterin molybdenumtransferase MoeA [Sphingobacteriia bacterium]TAH08610.1 MAG: molybdopterin molybdenumtransferase MoeA [Sphingobacteriia bacterium]
MKSVKEAKNIVVENAIRLHSIMLNLNDALGYTVSDSIFSPFQLPNFRQSSMDGYAIQFKDIQNTLIVQDELPAGIAKEIQLKEGQAIKVFTGGPIPDDANMVVQKEWVSVCENKISIDAEKIISNKIQTGLNIRERGSAIEKNELVIAKGTVLNSFQISLLASLGLTKIAVYKKPNIAIIITGNELVQPGNSLLKGQVYESNSFGLKAALKSAGIESVNIFFAKDTLTETVDSIQQALAWADLVLLTGGISVGDYDFVATACASVGIETLFHGVLQKPGKPLFVGKINSRLVFGLPGNPSSVLSCFQQYVLPALALLTGKLPPSPEMIPLQHSFEKKAGLCFFLKAYVSNGRVSVLPAQASFQLSAFTQANCWIELEETLTVVAENTPVPIYRF